MGKRKVDEREVARILADFERQVEAVLVGVDAAERRRLCNEVASELLAEAALIREREELKKNEGRKLP